MSAMYHSKDLKKIIDVLEFFDVMGVLMFTENYITIYFSGFEDIPLQRIYLAFKIKLNYSISYEIDKNIKIILRRNYEKN